MPQIGIRFEDVAFKDRAYDAKSSRYFKSLSDWFNHVIGQNQESINLKTNLHRLTTSDKPATCNPDARISFANLFSLHIFCNFSKIPTIR